MATLADRLSSRKLDAQEAEPIRLTRDRIFILPTRAGYLFALVLVAILFGAINYNNSLAFALMFLLSGLGLVSILHTYRNLAQLEITSSRADPVFAGQSARFRLCLRAPFGPERYAVTVRGPAGDREPIHTIPTGSGEACAPVRVLMPRRGLAGIGRVRISTEYPLGLLEAWSWVAPEALCLVYPVPEDRSSAPPPTGHPGAGNHSDCAHTGQDDFRGLRTYRPGDSLRHIAWRRVPVAPEIPLKEFSGGVNRTVWLDWHTLDGLGLEHRLSRLCRWILDSERRGDAYGLRMPDQAIRPSNGPAHQHRCLKALALFRLAKQYDTTVSARRGES